MQPVSVFHRVMHVKHLKKLHGYHHQWLLRDTQHFHLQMQREMEHLHQELAYMHQQHQHLAEKALLSDTASSQASLSVAAMDMTQSVDYSSNHDCSDPLTQID
jgi:hypothetical protein